MKLKIVTLQRIFNAGGVYPASFIDPRMKRGYVLYLEWPARNYWRVILRWNKVFLIRTI